MQEPVEDNDTGARADLPEHREQRKKSEVGNAAFVRAIGVQVVTDIRVMIRIGKLQRFLCERRKGLADLDNACILVFIGGHKGCEVFKIESRVLQQRIDAHKQDSMHHKDKQHERSFMWEQGFHG